jgi:Ca-activated chloride channel family protein
MLDWHWPWVVLALPLPWVTRAVLRQLQTTPQAIRVPFFSTLKDIDSHSNVRRQTTVTSAMAAAMWLALLIAAARPVWYGDSINVATSGRDLLLLVDLSDSMRINDMVVAGQQTQRIDVVKAVASDFIQRRAGDRIGLVLFGQRAYLQTPLTLDHHAVAVQLKEALPGFAGSSTAIGDAMGMGIKRLRDRPSSSRVIVLLSDGANTFGSEPLDATQVAVDAGIKIHTIAFGATEQTKINEAGQQVTVNPSGDLDTETLGIIARATGGNYFRARSSAELEQIYQLIDELEPTPEEELVKPERSLFHWPLALSMLFLMAALHTRRQL